MSTIINGRYYLHEMLGKGGMGTVYRATDRLTGEIVALKQLSSLLAHTPINETSGLSLTLAKEFHILASLHHPHIINVLNYGFDGDNQQRPFFTMTYLEDADTILEVGTHLNIKGKIILLQQVLMALTYLHRQNILHRDIKPSNVLVVKGNVRLLDFGLASALNQVHAITGTFAYLPPEIVEGQPVTKATDLYSVGLIAYQLFAGQHPFNLTSTTYFDDILRHQPDLTAISGPPALAALIGSFLAKDPTQRPQNAEDIIIALSQAANIPRPVESIAIRESYLQVPKFVGRQQELAQLKEALIAAQSGSGTSWLVGGESGVGKSRLLQELRTYALINGFLVLEGQATDDKSSIPFFLWREPLRRLLLVTDLDDLTATILRLIIPDIEHLLDRPVPQVPELAGQAAQQRLISAVVRLITQQQRPLLFILEDLQWSSESLLILQQLNRIIDQYPILIIASYRDDERPNLPQTMPHATLIKLERLSVDAIQELSTFMLGQAGAAPEILNFLNRETEGNAFFLVEVVRSLAQQAGQLSHIGQMDLPQTLLPAGIQSILQRRLAQVPPTAKPLLNLAAVLGRQLDLHILSQLTEQIELDNWLTLCANAAIIEMHEDLWRFAHDKLREAILTTFTTSQHQRYHQQIAQTIERIYPGDIEQVSRLSYLWRMAGNKDKHKYYARIAGEHTLTQYIHEEAIIHLTHALNLTTSPSERYRLLLQREQALARQGQRQAQTKDIAELKAIAIQLDDKCRQTEVAIRQSQYGVQISNYNMALKAAQQAVTLASTCGSYTLAFKSKLTLSAALLATGDYDKAQTTLETELPILRQTGAWQHLTDTLCQLGEILLHKSEYITAQHYLQDALNIIDQKLTDPVNQAKALSALGLIFIRLGHYSKAIIQTKEALEIWRIIGNRFKEAQLLRQLGMATNALGQYNKACTYYEQALQIVQEIDDQAGEVTALHNLGNIASALNRHEQAHTYYQKAAQIRPSPLQPATHTSLWQEEDVTTNGTSNRKQPPTVATSINAHPKTTQTALKPTKGLGKTAVFQQAIDQAQPANTLYHNGLAALQASNYEQAKKYFEASLNLSKESDDLKGIAQSLSRLGRIDIESSAFAEAYPKLKQSLKVAKASQDTQTTTYALCQLGYVTYYQGKFAESKQHYDNALLLSQQTNDLPNIALTLNGLGNISIILKEYTKAEHYHQRNLEICQKLGQPTGIARAYNNLGEIARKQAYYTQARHYYGEAARVQRANNPLSYPLAVYLNNQGFVSISLDDHQRATNFFRQSLHISTQIKANYVTLYSLMGFAWIAAKEQQWPTALALLGLVLNHPAAGEDYREDAEPALFILRNALTTETIKAGLDYGQNDDLDTIANKLLTETMEHPRNIVTYE